MNRNNSAAGVRLLLWLVALGVGSAAHARSTPLGTAFTYQGQIKLSGTPVNDTADFQFTLFDALSGPNQIGLMVPVNNISISNGLFTAALDFGTSAFDGNDRFLQIAVRSPAGSGSFATLTPRQKLTATPYALQTRGLFVDSAGKVGIGTTSPTHLLHVRGLGPAMALQDTASATNQAGYVSYRNDSNFETAWVGFGTAGDPDFSIVNARSGGDIVLSPFTGNVGIGTSTPSNRLSVNGSADFSGLVGIGTTPVTTSQLHVVGSGGLAAILAQNTGNIGSAVEGQVEGPTACAIRGVAHSTSGFNMGVCGFTESPDGVGVYGQSNAFSGSGVGVAGYANSPNGYDFFAEGPGINYGSPSSIRWKRNVELIDDPLEKVAQMRGVFFDWDAAHGGQHDVGFIGEEVGKVLPEVVAYEANGKFVTGMDYSKLTPLLTEAVKALRAEKDAQIEQLRAENQKFQDRLVALEAAVAHLNEQKENH